MMQVPGLCHNCHQRGWQIHEPYFHWTAAFLLLSFTLLHAADAPAPNTSWKSDLLAWRAQHAADLQKPTGWLTLIGLEWLKPGDNSFGSAKANAIVVKASV